MSDPHVHDSLAGKNVRVETYSRDIDVVTKDEAVGQFHEHQVERSDVRLPIFATTCSDVDASCQQRHV